MKGIITIVALTGFLLLSGTAVFAAEDKVKRFVQAMAKAEGFGIPGKIPTLAHNPIDLELGDKYGLGVLGEGITVMPDDATGWKEAEADVLRWFEGKSHLYLLDDSILTVAHTFVDGPNASVSQESLNWARNVAVDLGVNTTTTLRELVS